MGGDVIITVTGEEMTAGEEATGETTGRLLMTGKETGGDSPEVIATVPSHLDTAPTHPEKQARQGEMSGEVITRITRSQVDITTITETPVEAVKEDTAMEIRIGKVQASHL